MTPESLCMGCMGERGHSSRCVHCGWQEGSPAESVLQLPPRTVLDGRYLIGRALGQGGFGITYLAWDLNLECKLAVKEYFPRDICTRARDECTVQPVTHGDRGTFQEALKTFMEEGRALARFRDRPGVVSVLGFFQENGTAYIVMSYIEGLTLKEYLEKRSGKIDFKTALPILMPVMDTLKEVHAAGMLHRDISPDNIYLTRNSQVKLLDFGNARYVLGERSRSLSAVLKTGYAPEEQYRRQGHQGPWTDVYALAATFYRALTGRTPPEAPDRLAHDELIPPSQRGVVIPRRAERALLKALAVRQQDRYQSVADFQEEVNQLEPPPPPPPPGPHAWKWAVFAGIAMLALGVFWIIAHRPKTGALAITANVVGARISIDQRTQADWLTPHRFGKLAAGPHVVTVTKDGYQAASQQVNVGSGADERLEVNLRPVVHPRPPRAQFGGLRVGANVVGARISIDQRTQADWLTPYRFNKLSAGPHIVTATKDGYQAASQQVNVTAGTDETLEVNLRPVVHLGPPSAEFGGLNVRSNVVGATILIDGRTQSDWVTPYTFTDLPARRHVVTLKKVGYRSVRQNVAVKAGSTSSVMVELSSDLPNYPPFGQLAITSNVGGARITIDGKTQPEWLTPHTFVNIQPGAHTVAVAKVGFQAVRRRFMVRAGVPGSLDLTLSPSQGLGALVVTSNTPGARILIDGADTGFLVPHTFPALSAGPHAVSLLEPGYDPAGGQFTVQAAKSISANIPLSLPTQQLTLAVLEVTRSNPEGVPTPAEVFIDGKSYGRSPVKAKLPTGIHHYQVITSSASEHGSFKVQSEVGTLDLTIKIRQN